MSTRSHRFMALVAASTIAMTACSAGGDDGAAGSTDPETSSSVISNDGGTVALTGTSALKWDKTEATADAGEVTFTLTAEGAAHDIVIEELDDLVVVEAAIGETASAAISLTAGTYTYYCNIVGHRAAGMEGTLVVS